MKFFLGCDKIIIMLGKKKLGKKEFARLYDQFVEKIYRFIFLKVSSKETAEDLTSQVFLRFWQAREGVKDSRAFLYRIARNLVIDFYRQKGKAPLLSEEVMVSLADEKANTEYRVVLASDVAAIKDSLAKIKPEHSEAIILHYLDDLPISEVAKILERPEGTVRVMLHRGLEELREIANIPAV